MQQIPTLSLFSSVQSNLPLVEADRDPAVFGSSVGSPAGSAKLASATLETLFQGLISQTTTTLLIETLDAQRIELETTCIEPYGSDGLLWRGISPLFPGVEAHLSIVSDARRPEHWQVSGRLFLADGTRMLIQPGGEGYAYLSIMTNPRREMFANVRPIVQLDGGHPAAHRQSSVASSDIDAMTAIIRIMPAYPPSTLKVLGNDMAALKATIGDWQNLTNRIMQNSGINARIEMYDTLLELPEPKTNKVSELLAETLAARPGFPPYDNRGKGSLWDIVRQHRDSSQSDIVLLLAADWTDNSVIGEAGSIPLPPRVDKADDLEQCTLCFCPQKAGSLEIGQVFAHELGHLLGGSHDLETLMQTGMHYDDLPMFDYVCGYQAEDRSFMTIMGYPREEEVWIPYYSDSDQTWLNPKTGKREPVGIPVGKPNAADAAAFFRESTQTVAQYRNRDRAQADSYALSMDVEPPLGGTVLPSTWGPYPQGSVQTVRALPRAGYTFDQWELDGHPAGSTQPLSFHMYSDHRVVAHFTESATPPRLSIAVVADGLQDKVAMSVNVIDRDPKNNISGPSYPFGTEIHIDCNAGASILEKYTFSGWQINGNPSLIKGYEGHHYLGSTDVYDYFFRLVVRMEQDIKAEAVFEKK